MADTLDDIDILLLKTLQKNAKMTTKELAEAVHLTPTPVFERQKRLERQGYIKKYIAVLDPNTIRNSSSTSWATSRTWHPSRAFSSWTR